LSERPFQVHGLLVMNDVAHEPFACARLMPDFPALKQTLTAITAAVIGGLFAKCRIPQTAV
jgi:hypothetical protein